LDLKKNTFMLLAIENSKKIQFIYLFSFWQYIVRKKRLVVKYIVMRELVFLMKFKLWWILWVQN
jgi:hypothetical protein